MSGSCIPREIRREIGRQVRAGGRAAGSCVDGWGERGFVSELFGSLLGLGMKKRKRPGRRPVEDTGRGHTTWLCLGCGAAGQKPDSKAARSDADHHAAGHGFEHRYALQDIDG